MSTYYYGTHHQQQHNPQAQQSMPQPHHHHGRSRRAPRLSASQNSHRPFRGSKVVKELVVPETPNLALSWIRFEAGRSFELDDDLEFCPNLLTLDERQSVTSGSSDRSSLSSGSPESSPLQQQIQPQQFIQALPMTITATSAYISPPTFNNPIDQHLKIHQPSAIRSRDKAIPIVNPTTGTRIASPPASISPGMMHQTTATRRW